MPLVVLNTSEISPFFIASITFGRPSWYFLIYSTSIPFDLKYLVVPPVAIIEKPKLMSSVDNNAITGLCSFLTEIKTLPLVGKLTPPPS